MASRSEIKTCVLTVFGIVEMVLFSGVIFGWANVVLILKDEEYFKDLCADGHANATAESDGGADGDNCGAQDERLALIFTISVFAFNVAGFLGGALLDKLGTRIVRLIACCFFLLTGVFAFSMGKETANLMFPLVICLAFAGMLVAISIFQIAVLHQKYQFVVSSSFSGALDSSSVVFLLFKGIYDAGVSFRWILISYAIVAIFCVLCTTFILLPKTSIAVEQVESNKQKSAVELGVANPGVTADNVGDQQMTLESVVDLRDGDNFDDITKQSATENGQPKEAKPEQSDDLEKYASGWRYILTSRYLWLLYFFCIVQLRLWFYVGSLNGYLVYHTNDDKDKIETYSKGFGITQFFGFVFAPFTGLVMNLRPRSITNEYFGPMMSFILTLLLCLLLGGLVLVPVIEVQLKPWVYKMLFFGAASCVYFAFVVQVSLRAFLYASLISFVLQAFPVVHYGKLYGVSLLLGAVVSLLQYPAVIIIDEYSSGNPYWVNFGFFMLTFTALGFPIHLWLANRNVEETTSF